jgi:hypothetical protein
MNETPEIEKVLKLIQETPYDENTYKDIVVQGMCSHIKNNMPSGTTYQNSLEIINQLSLAKYKIDCGCSHLLAIVSVTSNLLFAVQEFFDDEVIPCTEWPTPMELQEFISNHVQGV